MATSAVRGASSPAGLVLGVHLCLAACVPLLAADIASEAATGKTVGGHALSGVTHKDCDIIGGALRNDRKVCEEPGSPATEKDFKGHGQQRSGSGDSQAKE